jgi:hypothetical protein
LGLDRLASNNELLWPRRRFLKVLGGAMLFPALAPLARAARGAGDLSSVLIIGDSMALCGFGPRLDERWRAAGVPLVNTYMACGTHPLSWTTMQAYARAQSRCGYWSIETGSEGPVSFQDTYGMRRGHRPSRYDVPKIEQLLPALRPDVLIVQLGNNLFDLLKGRDKARRGEVLDPFIRPFLARIAGARPAVSRVYWVTPPVSGAVSAEAQDTLVERIRQSGGPALRVIDSRELIEYPYRNLQPDKQHFFGADMNVWADRVFDHVKDDLRRGPSGGGLLLAGAQGGSADEASAEAQVLVVECELERMNVPYRHEEIAPYHESLVAFVYRVRRVLRGDFRDSHLVVLHAAHLGGKRQSMHRFGLGQRRILRLLPVDHTPWATLKAKDDVRFLDLERFIREEDHRKLTLLS